MYDKYVGTNYFKSFCSGKLNKYHVTVKSFSDRFTILSEINVSVDLYVHAYTVIFYGILKN